MDRHAHTHFHLPAPLDRVTVDALQEFNAIGRRIMWREPIDALRPGFRLVWDGVDPTEERRIYRWLRLRYEVIAKLREARAYTRGTGGAAIVIISMDGAPPDEPLDLANLQTVHRLVVRDRFEIWPDPQIDLDPLSPWFLSSRHYLVTGSHRSFRVHASRVVRFDGLPIPDRSRQVRNGWGGSEFDLIYDVLRDFGSSREDAAEAITLLTQGVFKMQGFAEAMSSKEGQKKILRRYKAMRLGMGTLGDIVIDAQHEGYELQSRTFSGLGELLDRIKAALQASQDMPEVLLDGSRSAGLNGGKDGDDIRGWYDFVGASRSDYYERQLMQLLVVLLSQPDSPTGGIVPEGFAVEWPPMWTPTPSESADIRNKNSSSRANDIASGVVDSRTAATDKDLAEIYTMPDPRPIDQGSLEPDQDPSTLVIQDESQIPDNETPVSAIAAARRMGFSSAGPVLRMIQDERIRVWRATPASPYRVLLSEVAREMSLQPVQEPLAS